MDCSPVRGVNDDVAENFRLATDAKFWFDFESRFETALVIRFRAQVFDSGENLNAAL